jgi:Zn-dependent protease with chaperone function
MTTLLNLFYGGSMLLSAIPGSFSWRLRFQESENELSKYKREQINEKIENLAKNLEIRKPIELVQKKGLVTIAQAQGLALFSSRAGIVLDPNIVCRLPEVQLEFLIAHELSHIKANDHMWIGVVSGIVGIITTSAMSILFPSSVAFSSTVATFIQIPPAALVGLSLSAIALINFSKWREECADKRGFSVCSDDSQEAAPEFFETIRTSQRMYRNDKKGSSLSKLWRKFLITKAGDARFDVLHPSLTTRIGYLTELREKT